MKNKGFTSKLLIAYACLTAVLVAILFGIIGVAVPFTVIPYKNVQLLAIEVATCLFIASFITIMSLFIYGIWFLNKLSRAMKKVANGDFSVRLPERKYSLSSTIYGDFNKMVSELESTQTLKNDFVGQFSHEFKTPITSINGFAELLLHEDVSEDKRKEYLQIIAEESKRLSNLSFQIMKLTKLENQKIITNQKDVKIDEELRQIIIFFMSDLEEKQLNYELNLQKANYYTDPELLKEVWINLLNNSIKFTPKGGNVFVNCCQTKNQVEVIIGNDGPQIEENEKQKILEKFYQGDTENKSQGLGLGLAIVKQILELIGGELEILSKYQNVTGAFFKVILPQNKTQA